jgi:hypothetical protein
VKPVSNRELLNDEKVTILTTLSLLEIYKCVTFIRCLNVSAGPKNKKGKNYRVSALGSDSQNLSKLGPDVLSFFIKYQTPPLGDRTEYQSHPKVSVPRSQSPPLLGGTKK